MKKRMILGITCLVSAGSLQAQKGVDTPITGNWTSHFQATVIAQSHSGFRSLYSGTNSLADSVEKPATSITSTLFLGRKLWKGAALYFNPELSGGKGLSFATGVAGALNGETYRVGNIQPSVFIARAYLQQHIPLGNTRYEYAADDVNQVADMVPVNRITVTAGKFSINDFYDNNMYSHDPRSQFMNWSLMANGAWDYPANTRGYTMGVVVELVKPAWSMRFSSVAVPRIANAAKMEYTFSGAHSETFEIEKKTMLGKRPGMLRFILTNTHSKAPSYADGMKAIVNNDTHLLAVISGNIENNTYGGRKTGLGFSAEQELTNEIGLFSRLGWNDGKYATWAFTEIDHTFSLGINSKGNKWGRPNDAFGIAGVINGISAEHRDFLKAGGYGFIIGDGNLNYGNEAIIETFYNAKLSKFLWLSLDYQFVKNPAYNKDRGPVHVFGVRAHIEM